MTATIKTFHSGTGDCIILLLKTENEQYAVMVDCGTYEDAIQRYVQEVLGKRINLLIVTHIDNDHIDGVKNMLIDQEITVDRIIFNCYQRNALGGKKRLKEQGDGLKCVCDTPYKSDIDELFSMTARACSMVDILNYKLKKKGYTTYSVGVGIDYGRALMIKAGCEGSGINDIIWMGDVVNQACHLCNDANSGYFDKRVFLSNVIYNNLNEDNQKLCSKDVGRDIYQANIINITMNDWLKKQK